MCCSETEKKPDQSTQRARRRFWLAAIMIVFFVLSVVVSFILPPRQGPDETAQYDYIRYIARSMGVYSPVRTISKRAFEESYDMRQPLYYSLAVAPYALAEYLFDQRGAPLRAVRLFSGIVGLIWVFVLYRLSRELFPNDDTACIFTTAFGSLLPSIIYLSAVVTNRLAEAVFFCGSVTMILKLIRTGLPKTSSAIGLGALMGFGLLTGSRALLIPVLGIAAVPLSIRRQGADASRQVWRSVTIAFITAFIISAWWFALSKARYGVWIAHPPSEPALDGGIAAVFANPGESFALFYKLCCFLLVNFWLPFDPAVAEIATSRVFLILVSAYVAIALCGMIIFLFVTRGDRDAEEPMDRGDVLLILFLAFFLLLAGIFFYAALRDTNTLYQGYLLLPAAGPVSAVMIAGYRGFSLNRKMRSFLMGSAFTVILLLNAVSVYSLWYRYTI